MALENNDLIPKAPPVANDLIPADLALAAQYESGWQNVPNYRFDPTHTASGIWQITNTTWNEIAPKLGLPTLEWPQSPMDRPYSEQRAVAERLRTERGMSPWAPYNPLLRQALSQRGYGTGLMAQAPSAVPMDLGPMTTPLQAASAPQAHEPMPPVIDQMPAAYGAGNTLSILAAMGAFGSPATHKFEPVDYDPWAIASSHKFESVEGNPFQGAKAYE